MKRILSLVLALSFLFAFDVNILASNATLPQWDLDYLESKVTSEDAEGFSVTNGAVPIFLDSITYKGADTKVFAWYGIPENASKDNPVPAIVLVHGGGGTASSSWVKTWVEKGYAAISIDTCGNTGDMGTTSEKERHNYAGPAGCAEENVRQIRNGDSIEDQWAYHAVAAVMRANSFIRSFDSVDSSKVGITGISWGGYLTEIAASVDKRFAFAIPVYGCGYLYDANTILTSYLQNSTEEQSTHWQNNWDPSLYIKDISCPTLFLTGNTDFAFPMDCYKKTYTLMNKENRWLCVKNGLNHSHADGQVQSEIFAFADFVVKGDSVVLKEVETGGDFPQVWATFNGEISDAKVIFTKDSGKWQDRKWESADAIIQSSKVSAQLPTNTTAYYFNVYDKNGNISSSTFFENAPGPDSYASNTEINKIKDILSGTENLTRYAFGENSLLKYTGNKTETLKIIDSARNTLNKEYILKSELSSLKKLLEETSQEIFSSDINATLETRIVREMRSSVNYAILYNAQNENKDIVAQQPPVVGDRRGVYITNENRYIHSIVYDELKNINDNNAYVFKFSFRQPEKATTQSIASIESSGTNGSNEVFGLTSDGMDIFLRCAPNSTGFSGTSGFTSYTKKIVENYEPNTWYDFTIVFDYTTRRLYPFVNGVMVLNDDPLYFAGANAKNQFSEGSLTGNIRLDFNSNNDKGMYISGIALYNYDIINNYIKMMDSIESKISVSNSYKDCIACADKYCLPTDTEGITWSSDDFHIQNGYGTDESNKLFAYTTFDDIDKIKRIMLTIKDNNVTFSRECLIAVSKSFYEKSYDETYNNYKVNEYITDKSYEGYYLIGGAAQIVSSSEYDFNGKARGNILKLDGTSSNRLALYTSSQRPSSGIRIVEVDLKYNNIDAAKANQRSQIYVQDRDGKCGIDVSLRNDGVVRVAGKYLFAPQKDTWYKITLVFDFYNRTCKTLINGKLSSNTSDIALPYALRDIGRIMLDARGCGEVYYDNLSIRSSKEGLYQYLYNGELPGITMITDANGNAVAEVQGGTYLGGKITMKNATKDNKSIIAILALYDEDNRLSKVSMKEIYCENDSVTESEFISEEYLTVPDNGAYYAKMFLLNSLNDLVPLSVVNYTKEK